MNYSERLNKVIPGGAHTYSRGDDQYPSNAPQIFKKGKGVYAYTPENKKFLDYGMGLRAVTIGYANKKINKAAIQQIKYGNTQTRPSIVELESAELLVDLIPSAEMVKFAKNGSTVTSAAVKIARAYTGRKYIIRCLDHPFFSYDDWFIGNTDLKRGIPEEYASLTLNFPFNDSDALEKLFDKYHNQIAGVILEPSTIDHPKEGFLENVKKLCHKNNALFILDEMITGFRWHLQGAQTLYNIEPDLSTFGKAMANGFSVSALTGKREFMEIGGIKKIGAERVFLTSSTHGAEMSSLGAFIATIDFYKKKNVIKHMWDYGTKLITQSNKIAVDLGIGEYFSLSGVPCSPVFSTRDSNKKISLIFRTLFLQEMIKNKVLMPCIALAYEHKDREMKFTLNAIEKSLLVYKKALEDGYEKYLVGDVIKPVFRKYN